MHGTAIEKKMESFVFQNEHFCIYTHPLPSLVSEVSERDGQTEDRTLGIKMDNYELIMNTGKDVRATDGELNSQ
jgi:hypothetical protein